MERDAFLSRVKAATVDATLPDHPPVDPGPFIPELPDLDLVATFTAVLEATDGVVHTGEPSEILRGISHAAPPGPYIAWDSVGEEVLSTLGRDRHATEVPSDPQERLAHHLRSSELVIGVTGAEAAFAESGTIVVRSGPGRPRMASLVPAIHVALLRRVDIHRSLSHWAASHAATIPDAANVVFITGPSRTADIEQQLNLGVHGPKELHVVLV